MKNFKVIIFISIIFSIRVFAQYGSEGAADARSLGLGNTSCAISRGVYSLGINPANLLKTDEKVDIISILPLPRLSMYTGTDFITINDISYYSDGKTYTENDKKNLNSLFNNGGLIFGNVSFTLLSFGIRFKPSIGAFAFSISDVIEGDVTVPQAMPSLLLYGNPQNSLFNFDDSKLNSWWIRDYSLSYAREIQEIKSTILNKLTVGISLKYFQGFEYAQSSRVNGNMVQTGGNNQITLKTNYTIHSAFSDNFHVKYSFDSTAKQDAEVSVFPSPAGTGFGFDLGFSMVIFKDYDVALAITDLGSITWDENTAQTVSTSQYKLDDIFDKVQRDSLKDKFKAKSERSGSFITELPTTLRFGAARKFIFNEKESFPGNLLVSIDINQGFNNEPGNSTKTRVSFGGEWKAARGFPVLRTGFSFGGLLGFHWGLGLGIDTGLLEFNFATYDLQSFIKPNSAKYLSVALDSRWKF